jgi:putative ABC transport system permease protein
MSTLLADLRYGLRMLGKNPGFTAVAVLTLALGIGANTTVFGWVEGVLLRPLPGVENPQSLFGFETFAGNRDFVLLSYPDYIDYRDNLKLLAGLATTEITPLSVGEADHPDQVWGEMVSGNYFSVLGVKPIMGRAFGRAEQVDTPGGLPLAVISYRLWREHFNSDPQILGKTIRVNQHQLTVIGVAPPAFRGAVAGLAFDLWIPYMMHPELQGVGDWMLRDRGTRQIYGLARLKPGVTLAQARAEVAALASRMSQANDLDRGITATLAPLWKSHYGAQSLLLTPLEILMAVCGVVLLIVCANVTNLLLARFSARQREFSVRLAMGASRRRLAQQILTECAVLAGIGGAAGVVLSMWLGGSLQSLLPPTHLPIALTSQLNGRILAFTVLLCTAATLLSGLAPAIQWARADVNEGLKEGGRTGTAGPTSHRLRRLLVVAEMALALVVLAGAGLLVRSFEATRNVDPEFDPSHVLLSRFFINTSGEDVEQRKEFCQRLRSKLEASAGVKDVAYSDVEPLGIFSGWWEDVQVEGYVPAPGENMKIYRAVVSPGYFRTMKIPVLEGRDFTEQDDLKTQQVMIVNQTFVKRYIPRGQVIGHRVHGWGEWFTVVGVAKDSKYINLTEAPVPFLYVPFRQVYRADMGLAFYVRVAGDPNGAIPLVRREVREVDPNVTVIDAIPMAEHVSETLYTQRVAASLLSVLAALALLLAAVGLYSVMAYMVTQRTHEIGIRMALGAQRKDVMKLAVNQGFTLTVIGIAAGVVAAVGLARLLGSFLYGVTAADPVTFAGVSALLALVALLANYVPARRATKVDPMVALRYE